MYDLKFIFEECGFGELPDGADRNRLFNVSFDVETGEIKLYVLDSSERFAYKISRSGIARQYSALDKEHGGDPDRLAKHLGQRFDFDEIVIDAVEGDYYYLYIEEAFARQYTAFIRIFCDKYQVTEARFLDAANKINKHKVGSIDACYQRKAVSGIKIPFTGSNCKIYSRPFYVGNGFELNEDTRRFLLRLYACDDSALVEKIKYMWVGTELHSGRTLIVTQDHELLHKRG